MRKESSTTGHIGRRHFLRVAGVAGVAGIAGCGGDDSDDTETATGSPVDTQEPAATPSATSTPTGGPDTDELEATVSDLAFEGELFDTHVHWHGARDTRHEILSPAGLAEQYANEGVGATTLFTSSMEVASGYADVLETIAGSEYDYLPFLEPVTNEHLTQGEVTAVYEEHPDVFRGIGEIVFYGGPMAGTSLTADPWPHLFSFVAEQDIPLMIHPTQEQEEGLRTMLSEYPDATVMGHGGEFNLERGSLEPLLENNDNLYWTLDAGSMLNGLVLRASDADDFASTYDQQADQFEQLVEQTLPWMMEAAPDRVMWGTDLATAWNTDPKVVSRVMDWTQAALDSLPEDQRSKYAYENAKRLFGL